MSVRVIRLLTCVSIVACLASCQLATTGKNGHNGNWTPLFDGTSLGEWKQSGFLNAGSPTPATGS